MAKLGINREAMFQRTSAQYLSGDVLLIVIRELLQNSVDAIHTRAQFVAWLQKYHSLPVTYHNVRRYLSYEPEFRAARARPNARLGLGPLVKEIMEQNPGWIEITINGEYPDKSVLSFGDNGMGMSREIIWKPGIPEDDADGAGPFLSLGSTGKSGEDAGGFGTAKAALFMAGKSWAMETRNTWVQGENPDTPGAIDGIRIDWERDPADYVDGARFQMNGFTWDPRQLPGFGKRYFTPEERVAFAVCASDLPGIVVQVNGQVHPAYFTSRKKARKTIPEVKWGEHNTVAVSVYDRSKAEGSGAMYIRLNHLFQFTLSPSSAINVDIVLDMNTTERPGSRAYPFDLARNYLQGPVRAGANFLLAHFVEVNGSKDGLEYIDIEPSADDARERKAAERFNARFNDLQMDAAVQEMLSQSGEVTLPVHEGILVGAGEHAERITPKSLVDDIVTAGKCRDKISIEIKKAGGSADDDDDDSDAGDTVRKTSGARGRVGARGVEISSEAAHLFTEALTAFQEYITDNATYWSRRDFPRVPYGQYWDHDYNTRMRDYVIAVSGLVADLEVDEDKLSAVQFRVGVKKLLEPIVLFGVTYLGMTSAQKKEIRKKAADLNPFGTHAVIKISTLNFTMDRYLKFQKEAHKYDACLLVWSQVVKQIVRDYPRLRMKVGTVALKRKTQYWSEGEYVRDEKTLIPDAETLASLVGDVNGINTGFVFDDTVLGLQGDNAIYVHPLRFREVVEAYATKPWAIAAWVYAVACHEAGHYFNRAEGGSGHGDAWVVIREDIGSKCISLLPWIEAVIIKAFPRIVKAEVPPGCHAAVRGAAWKATRTANAESKKAIDALNREVEQLRAAASTGVPSQVIDLLSTLDTTYGFREFLRSDMGRRACTELGVSYIDVLEALGSNDGAHELMRLLR